MNTFPLESCTNDLNFENLTILSSIAHERLMYTTSKMLTDLHDAENEKKNDKKVLNMLEFSMKSFSQISSFKIREFPAKEIYNSSLRFPSFMNHEVHCTDDPILISWWKSPPAFGNKVTLHFWFLSLRFRVLFNRLFLISVSRLEQDCKNFLLKKNWHIIFALLLKSNSFFLLTIPVIANWFSCSSYTVLRIVGRIMKLLNIFSNSRTCLTRHSNVFETETSSVLLGWNTLTTHEARNFSNAEVYKSHKCVSLVKHSDSKPKFRGKTQPVDFVATSEAHSIEFHFKTIRSRFKPHNATMVCLCYHFLHIVSPFALDWFADAFSAFLCFSIYYFNSMRKLLFYFLNWRKHD